MVKTYFTADTHFGHATMLKAGRRPFATTAEMDEALVASWNSVVTNADEVWHLGDFAYKSEPGRAAQLFARLKGTKRLVRGNHDEAETLALGWAEVVDFKELVVDSNRVVLSHYPMREWPGFFRGNLHLFGHCHGTMPGSRTCLDAGVDNVGFVPQRLAQLKERMSVLPELQYREGQPKED